MSELKYRLGLGLGKISSNSIKCSLRQGAQVNLRLTRKIQHVIRPVTCDNVQIKSTLARTC